jgi:hypothetical protein
MLQVRCHPLGWKDGSTSLRLAPGTPNTVCLQTTDVSKDRLLWCLKARLSLAEAREWPLRASPTASIVEARRLGSPVEILLSGKCRAADPKTPQYCLNEAWRTWNLIVLRAARRLNTRVFILLLSAGEIAPRPFTRFKEAWKICLTITNIISY